MKKQEFKVTQIGVIRAQGDGFCLELDPAYAPALKGLQGFSHLNVLWWSHLCDTPEYRAIVECDQPYKKSPPKLGIFATRSPLRPNPISLTPVAVLHLDEANGKIYIPYIDAEDGTPILDIKPYHPCIDRLREVCVPEWCRHWPQWNEDSATFDWSAEFVNAR